MNGRTRILICALLIGVGASIYVQVRQFDFVNFDDYSYVRDNPRVQPPFAWDNVRWAFTTRYFFNWHPLTWLSHMLDCRLFGLRPGAHHLVNVFFHLANTLLLFEALFRMTKAPWRSALVAGLFAAHPLHVESVAWIAERKDVLSTFFEFAALLAYIRYVKAASLPLRSRETARMPLLQTENAAVFAAFGLAAMAKPMVVTFPVLLLLLDYWPLGRYRDCAAPWRRFPVLVLEKIPLFALAAFGGVMALWAQHGGESIVPLEALPPGRRLANAAMAYVLYLGRTVWPSGLAAFYPPAGETAPSWQPALAAFLLMGTTALALRLRRSHPYAVVGWSWYLATLLPVIGIVQVGLQSSADRYTYVPLVGIFIMAAWGLGDLVAAFPRTRVPLCAMASAAVLLLACAAHRQAGYWRDSVSLFEHAAVCTRDNAFAEHNLAMALEARGDAEAARKHLEATLRIDPNHVAAHYHLARIEGAAGRIESAAAHCREAIRLDPRAPYVRNSLGAALLQLGDPDGALRAFAEELDVNPGNADALANMGSILLERGDVDAAVRCFLDALEHNPAHRGAQAGVAEGWLAQGLSTKAAEAFQAVVARDPSSARAWYQLGGIAAREQRWQEAERALREARRRDPSNTEIANNLGNALAAQGRFDEAVAEYKAALGIDDAYVNARLNLGVALAQSGHPEDAVAEFSRILEIRPDCAQAKEYLDRLRDPNGNAVPARNPSPDAR